jgi:hypothetical protein
LPVYDGIRIREGVISMASEVVVNLRDSLLHSINEGIYLAQAILIFFAPFNSSERKDTVVKNPADVCWYI